MKATKNCEGYYVDELGNVFSNKIHFGNKNGELRKLKPKLNKNGYYQVSLRINKKRYNKYVHRLVAQAYIPNPENKPQVNHINGIKTDCRVVNLEWCTIKENSQHAFDIGLRAKGENHLMAKLTKEQVLLIRADVRTQRKIAIDYGVTHTLIGYIKRREIWNHIK